MLATENRRKAGETVSPRRPRTRTARFHGQTMAEYNRIMDFLGVKTQLQLAERLGVRQSSVSDALGRANEGLPANWKLSLLKSHGLSPLWVETGLGAMYMVGTGNQSDLPAKTPLTAYSASELLMELNRRAGG